MHARTHARTPFKNYSNSFRLVNFTCNLCNLYCTALHYTRHRESGRLVWHNMLRFGASKDTGEMLSDLAGGSLDPAHFLKTIL